ncbi:MAG: BMC domain-containing protein [Clostridia bacterium]|nr:BMC domain-containing protein [Clostridia bacterium]
MKSLGFVEVSGVVAAIDALDIMCKSADVSLVSWERKLGGRLVTLIVTGDVSAVTAAVDSAKAQCIKKPCASAVIANPHPETVRLAELSAKRLEKQSAAKKQKEAVTESKQPAAKKTATKTKTTEKKGDK